MPLGYDRGVKNVLSPEEIKKIWAEKGITQRTQSFTKLPETQGNPVKPLSAPIKKTPSQRRWEIDRILEQYDLHPIEEMVKALKDNEMGGMQLSTDQRIRLLGELASYTVPKVKSIEVSGSIDHSVNVTIMKFEDIVKAAVPAVDVEEVKVLPEVANG